MRISMASDAVAGWSADISLCSRRRGGGHPLWPLAPSTKRVSIRYTAVIGFARGDHDELVCDSVPLSAIAEAEGTPVYVYSAALFAARYHAIETAFGAYPHALHYALKANSTLALARLMRELG